MIFTTDMMLSLIIISLIIGISASLLETSAADLNENFRTFYYNSKTLQAANILTNTPGDPPNWERLPEVICRSPGLAVPDNPGVISYEKVLKLKSRPALLEKLFPGMKTQIILRPLNHYIPPVVIKNDSMGQEVYSVRKYLVCRFMADYVIVSKGNYKESICPHGHQEGWRCVHFKITDHSRDYYLVSDPINGCWILDTATEPCNEEQRFGSDPVRLNDKIDNLTSINSVLWLHIRGGGRVFIIGVPRGSRDYLLPLEYFQCQPCVLEISASV